MRDEIKDSIARMTGTDLNDVIVTLGLRIDTNRTVLKQMAFANEDIAEYVLQY